MTVYTRGMKDSLTDWQGIRFHVPTCALVVQAEVLPESLNEGSRHRGR